jgi:hypothetical protein
VILDIKIFETSKHIYPVLTGMSKRLLGGAGAVFKLAGSVTVILHPRISIALII